MPTQRIIITDARGRTAMIEVWTNDHTSAYLRQLPEAGYPKPRHYNRARWRALTLAAFGAQSRVLQERTIFAC